MLYGNLRDFAEAIIKGDKYKAPSGNLRDLAEAILTGDKYKAWQGCGAGEPSILRGLV